MSIVWIAGWPHNGSTLLRQIFKQCFNVVVYSKYPEKELDFLFGESSVAFSEDWIREPWRKYLWCKNTRVAWPIKTHEIPVDNAPAIFVVRDGRDAVTALSHFWRIPIADCIVGQSCVFGNWTSCFWAWNPLERPNTLLVKYEDMVNEPDSVAQNIGEFLKIKPQGTFKDDFEECQKKYPQLFNVRIGCWEGEMSPDDISLFWKCHGEVMKLLGYGRNGPQRQVANE